MASGRPQEMDRNQAATVYVGNLDERCTDPLVWELFLQVAPIANVHLPKDRVSMNHQGYGFVEFLKEEDAAYAVRILNGIKLYGKPIRVNKASAEGKPLEIGAKLFIGNLDPAVDEALLYKTFSHFGKLTNAATVARDPSTGASKGYGFLSYDSFESSDAAIEQMDNQYLMNKIITVQYALNKDKGKGERHGTTAERLLAAQARKNNAFPSSTPLPSSQPPPPSYGQSMAPPPPPQFQHQTPMGMPPPPPPQPMGYQSYSAVPPPPPGFSS